MGLDERGVIDAFLSGVWRRHLLQLTAEAGARAAAVGVGACIVLLLAGTQLLNWWWPVAIFAVTLAVAAWRAKSRLGSKYRIAQRVDRNLELHDAVSSAYYFRKLSPHQPGALERIERQAAEAIAPYNSEVALPFKPPRAMYVLAGLTAAAFGLFVLRYGILRTMDLGAPIANLSFELFPTMQPAKAASRKSAVQEKFEKQLEQFGISLEDLDTSVNNSEATTDQTAGAEGSPDGNVPMQTKADGEKSSKKGDSEGTEASDASEEGQNSTGAEKGDSEEIAEAREGSQQQPADKSKNGRNEGSSSSVMDKMRDALSNLMAKMRPQNKNSEQDGQGQQSQGQSERQQQAMAQKGMQGQSRSQGEGQQSADQQSGEEGDGEKVPGAQNKPSERSADRPGAQEGKSGVGKQDGVKDLKEAEQIAAMGKISELIGKRSQTITGEMTVETPSGKQQLRTAYTNRRAEHTNAGAEVHRDEIPLMYQTYVQRYFEEVRKGDGKKAAAPSPSGPNQAEPKR